MTPTPRDGLRSFLSRAEDDGWIASHKWVSADSWPALKEKLKGPTAPGFSRTHKKGTDGLWWALEVEAHEGTAVGVDLEILFQRPVLEKPDWILRRLNLARGGTARSIIEEWSSREAAFKSLAPDNQGLLLSQLRRSAPNVLQVLTSQGDRQVQVRTAWTGHWCMSLGWRTT